MTKHEEYRKIMLKKCNAKPGEVIEVPEWFAQYHNFILATIYEPSTVLCDHVIGAWGYGGWTLMTKSGGELYPEKAQDEFEYCPKCGSKLDD